MGGSFSKVTPEQVFTGSLQFSVRVDPGRFLELTSVEGIKPARYMARFHWVTIVDVRRVPPAYLRELIAWSYDKALSRLSKRKQFGIIMGDSRQ